MTRFKGPHLKIHLADKVNPDGGVSPLCAAEPYSIDLSKERWTLDPHFVTCGRCHRANKKAPRERDE